MHKDKNGNIIASLTEVKNKTGDIFSLADEFGEVILTSYNKPRYKLSKIDISEILDLQSESPSTKKSKSKKKAANKKIVSKAEAEIEEPKADLVEEMPVIEPEIVETPNVAEVYEENETDEVSEEESDTIPQLDEWNPESEVEMAFIEEIKQPLQ